MKLTLRREGETRSWPEYLLWGRMRTSTMGLIVAFFAVWWLYATYQPPPVVTPTNQPGQIVPPGYVPDPEYTWVPRTNVQETERSTPTTTTTTPTTTETTPDDDATTTTTPDDGLPTTVVDPDGPGPMAPSTVSPSPTVTPGQTPTTLPTTPTTTAPGPLSPLR